MADENDKKSEKEIEQAENAVVDRRDAIRTSQPPADPREVKEEAHPSAPPSGTSEYAKPTEGSKLSDPAARIAADALEVHKAQLATHQEQVIRLTRDDAPLKPEHSANVRVVYRARGEAADDAVDGVNDAKPALLLAEFDGPGECMHAAEKLRDAGYTKFDTHTPFPVHGMDAAMGMPDSRLGWIVLACGLTGVSCAWLMMWWMNGIDYPLIVGGKPPYSLPSMIPIMFELTILLSSFGAVFGMFAMNKLPMHHHAIFYSDRFAAFSNDKFFVSVEAGDPKFNIDRTRELLERCHPGAIELIEEKS